MLFNLLACVVAVFYRMFATRDVDEELEAGMRLSCLGHSHLQRLERMSPQEKRIRKRSLLRKALSRHSRMLDRSAIAMRSSIHDHFKMTFWSGIATVMEICPKQRFDLFSGVVPAKQTKERLLHHFVGGKFEVKLM